MYRFILILIIIFLSIGVIFGTPIPNASLIPTLFLLTITIAFGFIGVIHNLVDIKNDLEKKK